MSVCQGVNDDDVSDASSLDVTLTWVVIASPDDAYEETMTVDGDGDVFASSWLHEFRRPGNFTIGQSRSS